jgi:ribulose-phosphate 3-epimerase
LPSLLLCDFGNLEQEIRRLEAAGVRALHLDVMDGHFVPNLSYGLTIVSAVRRVTPLPLDAHLMIAEPQRWIEAFYVAGADIITVHAEAVDRPQPVLRRILGAGAGIAIKPATPISSVLEAAADCDLVLVMSVEPGFGGQEFESSALGKLNELKRRLPSGVLLEVDGGINDKTIGPCVQAGADLCVVGSAIFRHRDYSARVRSLSRLAESRPLDEA